MILPELVSDRKHYLLEESPKKVRSSSHKVCPLTKGT